MKNYFNCEERTRHIILLAMQEVAKEMQSSEAITPKERQMLAKIEEWTTKFNSSVFERYGEAYARKIEKTMQANTLRLVGKYNEQAKAISHVATEDLELLVDELHAFKCLDCDKANYKDCATYNICVSCDVEGNGNSEGCPFRSVVDNFINED